MMGGVLPETCRASYKYGITNFDKLLHLVGFFCINCTVVHGSTNIKFTVLCNFGLFRSCAENTEESRRNRW
jgi:hypothetical protein